ncbi:metallophosphoesterase [Solidesulfovibrio carbinoliphilus subsp. oakridgensis]|uniref:Metallophosphoesterase n=1 Tax=Solidesulfovibrio carbinoliphilus subsp. oakridgensis TaxID=694327 RepID=G7Q5U8_9BACT|nr:metallophosphoesterase family protein [Solidesulfovibrio carbinoliphilus]EHJ46885.1 metallophosphoesterase [Solidesulfovibrio carbinoliphilus subsp. oakridgensis]
MAEGTYWIGIGDVHDDIAALGRIPGLGDAAGVVVSGDLTIRGGAASAKLVLEAVRRRNPVVMAQIGNMDTGAVDAYLTAEGVNLHATGRVMPQGVGFFGCGWSTPTPFHTPSEAGEERVAAWLEAAHAVVAHCPHLVMVCHTPPFGTAADVVGSGAHVGSQAVRDFISRVQPAICLTGHIHEARSIDSLGRTVIVNPGALADGGYARITLGPGGLAASLLTV